MNDGKETKPIFTDVQREIIASSLEAVIELEGWVYAHFEDLERARLGHGLTPEKRVRDVVRRTRDNDLVGLGHFELTMMREALLAAAAAGLELGAPRAEVFAAVRQIQRQRNELAIQRDELEGSETARTEHFRFNAELASRAFGELAGLTPKEIRSYFAGRYSEAPAERCAVARRHSAVGRELERRSEDWIRRDRETWDPDERSDLYWEVQNLVSEAASLAQGTNYSQIPSEQRDCVIATIIRIAPLIDWDVHFALAEAIGLVTPPKSVSTT